MCITIVLLIISVGVVGNTCSMLSLGRWPRVMRHSQSLRNYQHAQRACLSWWVCLLHESSHLYTALHNSSVGQSLLSQNVVIGGLLRQIQKQRCQAVAVKMRSLYWGSAWCLLISSFNSGYFAPLLAISAIRNQHLLAMSCECSARCAFAHILLVKHQSIPPGSTSRFSSLKLPHVVQSCNSCHKHSWLFCYSICKYLAATPVWPEHMAQVAIPLNIQTE